MIWLVHFYLASLILLSYPVFKNEIFQDSDRGNFIEARGTIIFPVRKFNIKFSLKKKKKAVVALVVESLKSI